MTQMGNTFSLCSFIRIYNHEKVVFGAPIFQNLIKKTVLQFTRDLDNTNKTN